MKQDAHRRTSQQRATEALSVTAFESPYLSEIDCVRSYTGKTQASLHKRTTRSEVRCVATTIRVIFEIVLAFNSNQASTLLHGR